MGDLSPHFDRREFRCKDGCGFDTVDAELLEVLESVRQHFDAPVTINSACRCAPHNQRVGGSPKSQHLYGRAADIVVRGVAPNDVAGWLERTYLGRLGIGRYDTFTHVDSRFPAARFDQRSKL